MLNPFKKVLDSERDVGKKRLNRQISDLSWNITQKIVTGKNVKSDIDDLEQLYNEFFAKYPDKSARLRADKRLKQLKQICK